VLKIALRRFFIYNKINNEIIKSHDYRSSKVLMKWSVRKAENHDVGILVSMARRVADTYNREFLGDEVIDEFINSGACDKEVLDNLEKMYVLLYEDRIIGYCVLHDNWVKAFLIDIEYHGTGAAKYFLTELTQKMSGQYESLHLECFEPNARAIAFYEKFGWKHYKTEYLPDLKVNNCFYRLTTNWM
jgi:RimJ/RimL family protein N-acetyltransferase